VSKKNEAFRANADFLRQYLARNPTAATPETAQALRGELAPSPMAQALADIGLSHHQRKAVPEPIKGLSTKQSYMDSLLEAVKTALPEGHVEFFPDGSLREVVVWFSGARMLTINQMISLFTQAAGSVGKGGKKKKKNTSSIPFNYFKYKNRWHEQMKKVIADLRAAHEFSGGFIHPVTVEVMRHATRPVDRDALPTMFKILTDALRHNGIIRDDNPDEVVDITSYQKKVRLKQGERPGVGMRLVAQPGWVPPPVPDVARDWLRKSVPFPDC
jgi:Holliday junction resolvase RusA-like endonuclease